MYVDLLRSGTQAQNILTKIGKEMQISRETLRVWKRDGHWSLKANVEILKSAKLEFMQILRKLSDQLTPENAAEMGRLVFDAIQSVEVKPNGTESHSQAVERTGNSGGPPVRKSKLMTTIDFITQLFIEVDDKLTQENKNQKHSQANLYPSTVGLK